MNSRTVAIVAERRPARAPSDPVFRDLTALDLGKACVREPSEGGEPGATPTDRTGRGRSFHVTA